MRYWFKKRPSAKSRSKILVQLYDTHADVESDRDNMRRAGYYLASVSSHRTGKVRSVWVNRHQVEMRGPVNA